MDHYYIYYDKGHPYNKKHTKLVLIKITNTSSQHFKTDDECGDDYIKINEGYIDYEINTRKELQFLNSNNFISEEKKEEYKTFLDTHIKTQNLDNYSISYLYFDKYKQSLKSYLGFIGFSNGEYFGNKEINSLLLKIHSASPGEINNGILFSQKDCKLLYNFLDFLYFKMEINDLYKLDKSLTVEECYKKYPVLCREMTTKEFCENINEKFIIYMDKLNKNDTSLFNFNKTYYSRVYRNFYNYNSNNPDQKIDEFNAYTNQELNKATYNFITNLDFNKATRKEITSFIGSNYYNLKYNNHYNQYKIDKAYLPHYSYDSQDNVIMLYTLNNNYHGNNNNNNNNNTKNAFINNYIFSNNTKGIFKFKFDIDFNYTEYITRVGRQRKTYITALQKFDIYIHKDIFRSLFQCSYINNLNLPYMDSVIHSRDNTIIETIKETHPDINIVCIEWILNLFHSKFNGNLNENSGHKSVSKPEAQAGGVKKKLSKFNHATSKSTVGKTQTYNSSTSSVVKKTSTRMEPVPHTMSSTSSIRPSSTTGVNAIPYGIANNYSTDFPGITGSGRASSVTVAVTQTNPGTNPGEG